MFGYDYYDYYDYYYYYYYYCYYYYYLLPHVSVVHSTIMKYKNTCT